MHKKIFILSSVLLFVLLILIAGYYYLTSNKTAIEIPQSAPTTVPEIKPENYKNDVLGFEITLPTGLTAEEKTDGNVVIIGEKILVYELDSNPEICKGVCSIITKGDDVEVNDIKMRYLEGYWEELGEDNAQSFVSFVIPRGNRYLIFMLQELPVDAIYEEGREAGKVNSEELRRFTNTIESVNLI